MGQPSYSKELFDLLRDDGGMEIFTHRDVDAVERRVGLCSFSPCASALLVLWARRDSRLVESHGDLDRAFDAPDLSLQDSWQRLRKGSKSQGCDILAARKS